jgi:hypothetical protein
MRSFVTILLVLLSFTSLAQYSIQGSVFDGQTGTPLPGANVFISNTTKGVSSDANGEFKIDELHPTRYNVVIQFIGYKTQSTYIAAGGTVKYKILLMPDVKQLDEIVIRAKPISVIERANYLRTFTENFVGNSENASQCKFINDHVLTFDKDGDMFTVRADSTLIMRNSALGYDVDIHLDKYVYNAKTRIVHFEGNMVYRPLTPAGKQQEKRRAKERLTAYYGSEMHFLRSLYSQKANEEGWYFHFLSTPKTDTLLRPRSKTFNDQRVQIKSIVDYKYILDSARSKPSQPVLKNSGDVLEVSYINESQSPFYQRFHKLKIQRALQTSIIRMRRPAEILPDGRVFPVSAIEIGGYWSWELMADALPLDYEPNDDLKLIDK